MRRVFGYCAGEIAPSIAEGRPCRSNSEAGRLDEAVKLYRQVLRRNPKWTEGWRRMGTIFYEQDRHAEAVESFKRLLLLDDRSGPAWALLGLSLYQLKNYQPSIASLERAAAIGVGANQELQGVSGYHSAEMHFALARAYEKAGRKADAQRARAEFVRLDKQRRALREGAPVQNASTP